ncbi:Kanamycin B dioxygenase [Hyphodiscus hymeniophilus]|uniref:Kanamycin B dioxygenase n=1 Tax=Hyphodiscus hymeniophilus TaxID=353542 RepID=A0A9P6VMU5_9HELO|nr:Kanamycin B dioxygenase [Hyphodiscus hymeniophilus]
MALPVTQNQQSHIISGKSPQYVDGALVPEVDKHGDNPVVIRLTDEERLSGKTKPETIQEILKYYHRDGFVVLENAIDEHLVDRLYNRMVQDNAVYIQKPQMRYNQGVDTGNISQIPPLTPEWLHRDFYANPHMIRVVENILGPRPELRFINSNVAVPGGTGRQAVHSDVHHAYPEIPFGLVMNIYLQDSDESNGITEVWCGTHNCAARKDQQASLERGWIKKSYLQERAKVKRPVQPKVKKGSICFRDLRLWHAGMPNKSDHHRIMLAIDYFAQWYQCPMKTKLPLSMKETIEREWEGISTEGVEWVDGDLDSLDLNFFLNMTQDPLLYLEQTDRGFEDWRARATGQYNFDTNKVTEENYWTPE